MFLIILTNSHLSAQKDYFSSYELLISEGKRNFDGLLGGEMKERMTAARTDVYNISLVKDLDEDQKFFALLKSSVDLMHVSRYKSTNPKYKEVLSNIKRLFFQIQLPNVKILNYKSGNLNYQTLLSETKKPILTMNIDETTNNLEIWVYANWDQPK